MFDGKKNQFPGAFKALGPQLLGLNLFFSWHVLLALLYCSSFYSFVILIIVLTLFCFIVMGSVSNK